MQVHRTRQDTSEDLISLQELLCQVRKAMYTGGEPSDWIKANSTGIFKKMPKSARQLILGITVNSAQLEKSFELKISPSKILAFSPFKSHFGHIKGKKSFGVARNYLTRTGHTCGFSCIP